MSVHETDEVVVIGDLPEVDDFIVLTPEPALPVHSEVVATLESGKRVLKMSARVGLAGEVMDARMFIGDSEDPGTAERKFGIAAAALAQSIERS